MQTLSQACETSFNKGETEEEQKQFGELRENLLNCFIWMCHMLDKQDQNCERVGIYMFEYIIKLIGRNDLGYSADMLKNIVDMYSDIVLIFG